MMLIDILSKLAVFFCHRSNRSRSSFLETRSFVGRSAQINEGRYSERFPQDERSFFVFGSNQFFVHLFELGKKEEREIDSTTESDRRASFT